MIQYTILTLHMVLYRSVKVVPDTTNQCTICCQSQEYLIRRLFVPDMVYRCTVPGVTDVPSILTHIFTQCSLSSGNFERGARLRLVCLGVVFPLVNSP